MRYHTNFIGSFFGFGKLIIAEPEIKDFFRDINVRILETIAESSVLDSLITDPKLKDQAVNTRIKAQKLIDYEMRKREIDGYYGHVDLPALHELEQEMAEDWWLREI